MNPKHRGSLLLDMPERRSNVSSNDAVFQIGSQNDKDRLKNYLGSNNNINIFEIADVRNYTLCHLSCINNSIDMLEIFIEYIQKNLANLAHKIPEWVNKKNSDGYTPLHMASFKGNIKLIKYLEKLGADQNAKNKHGF